jgi:methylphosphotriester-DNA--protein-cysteine methyltransferase
MKCILSALIVSIMLFTTAGAQFVGSKNSNKYHTRECQWAKRISSSNLVTFKTAEDATNAGYIPCKVCSPLTASKDKPVSATQKSIRQRATTPLGDGRCEAITKKGTRCTRRAQPGSRYCWQHQR